MRIELQYVHYMPKELQPGILYVSKEFGTAAHLCPCGCGSKVRTPLGPTEWELKVIDRQPFLSPSVGNWQQTCQSHYWIERGEILWSEQWTDEQIAAGRRFEEVRRHDYYNDLYRRRNGIIQKIWNWIRKLFTR